MSIKLAGDRPAPSPLFRLGHRWPVPLAAVTLAALYWWMSWCAFPGMPWNEVRLAPAFALRHGWPVYAPLGGGPLSTWIYGPLGVIVNLPATWARSAVGALQVSGLVNFLTLVGPLAVIFLRAPELRRHGWPARVLALALGGLLLPYVGLIFQVPDHTSTALGLLSCWCLTRSALPGPRHTALAAALCVGAMGAKQIEFFLVPAQAAFLLSLGARRACAQFLAWIAVFGGIALALAVASFGAGNLWFNLATVPGRLPWTDVGDRIVELAPKLLAFAVLPWVLLVVLRRRGPVPGPDTTTGRFLRCSVFAALATLPVGCAAVCKIGGALNSIHCDVYLYPALVLAWFAQRPPTPVGALAAVGLALALHAPEFPVLRLQPVTQSLASGERLARANPRQLWFPQNPLITFYSDGKLYHVEDGLATRYLAGYGVREQEFRRYLPAQLTAVVYPAEARDLFALQLLSDFSVSTPYGPWTLHQKRPTL